MPEFNFDGSIKDLTTNVEVLKIAASFGSNFQETKDYYLELISLLNGTAITEMEPIPK